MNKALIKTILSGGKNLFVVEDRGKAIDFAINEIARKGDTLLVTGKGHEKSLCRGKTEEPWDEYEAVKKALFNKI